MLYNPTKDHRGSRGTVALLAGEANPSGNLLRVAGYYTVPFGDAILRDAKAGVNCKLLRALAIWERGGWYSRSN